MKTMLIALVVFTTVLVSAQTTSPTAAADAAFDAGRMDVALKLYDEVLARDPMNVQALTRSAMMLSWQKQWDEAIRRYEKVLSVDPKNEKARLERAKVLSWSHQYAKSIAAFRELEASEPGNIDAMLGVGRVLSWSGNQPAARQQYLKTLQAHPDSLEAMLGVAQTYAWSGSDAQARTWYNKVLAVDPARREAVMGMAYLDLESGDRLTAERGATQLATRFPNDDEVVELRTAVKRAGTPTLRTMYDHIDDTDRNRVDTWGVESAFPSARNSDLTFGYTHYDLEDFLHQKGTIESGYGSLALRPALGQRLILRGGVDRLNGTVGSDRNKLTGRIAYVFGAGSSFETALTADHRPFRYTTTSLDRGVTLTAYTLSMTTKPNAQLQLTFGGGYWHISDSNNRQSADAALAWRFPMTGLRTDLSYNFHYFDYDKRLGNGYFDPQNFRANSLQLDLHKDFRTVYATAMAERGVQSFTLAGVSKKNDHFFTYGGTLGIRFSKSVVLELGATKSDSASQNPAGFESKEYTARLRIQPSP